MWKFLSSAFLLISFAGSAQNWTWTELDTMPFRTANNAVCEAVVNGNEFVYSFGGIDTSKAHSGIHTRSFKFEVAANTWTEIDPLSDSLPVIAAGASFVKNKIYILGGYHVFQNSNEISSNRVRVYNPQTESYEADGAPIPLAIDDHVQCVYKDSLIFVVTGWSNTSNFPNVQIYDPTLNQWQNGTFVPTSFQFTAFGASGYIVGDTLYYHGGAAGGSFAARKFMRKGYINPNDPTDITWEYMGEAPGDPGYRAACSGTDELVFWVGGAPTSYNYDGIAYNGSGGVDPSARILHFRPTDSMYLDETNQPYGVMDLRGIAKLSNNRWIVCGGMDTNQIVSNRTLMLESTSLGLNSLPTDDSMLQSVYHEGWIEIRSKEHAPGILFNMQGQTVITYESNTHFEVSSEYLDKGVYIFQQGKRMLLIRL